MDSDGDGCPDAKEAGVNGVLTSGTLINTTSNASSGVFSTTGVANAIAVGPYGNNGLADDMQLINQLIIVPIVMEMVYQMLLILMMTMMV